MMATYYLSAYRYDKFDRYMSFTRDSRIVLKGKFMNCVVDTIYLYNDYVMQVRECPDE